jgi:hypothetical protein
MQTWLARMRAADSRTTTSRRSERGNVSLWLICDGSEAVKLLTWARMVSDMGLLNAT